MRHLVSETGCKKLFPSLSNWSLKIVDHKIRKKSQLGLIWYVKNWNFLSWQYKHDQNFASIVFHSFCRYPSEDFRIEEFLEKKRKKKKNGRDLTVTSTNSINSNQKLITYFLMIEVNYFCKWHFENDGNEAPSIGNHIQKIISVPE